MIGVLILHLLFGSLQGAAKPTAPQVAPADRRSPCSEFKASTIVFVGEVMSSDPSPTGHGRTVRFNMGEWMTSQTSLPSQLRVSIDDGPCGMEFKSGENYLVFAIQRPDGGYETSACAGSKKIEEASDEIEMIRSLSEGRPEARVFGDIKIAEAGADPLTAKPVAEATVTANGPGGPYETTTDEDGRFRFDELMNGEYTLTAVLPQPYTQLNERIGSRKVTIQLPNDCGGEVHFIP